MTPLSNESDEYAVLYFVKQLESRTSLECGVSPMPQHEFHRVTYNFTLSFRHGGKVEAITVEDVTTNIREAENLFNLICKNNLHPCHLHDVVCDYIGRLPYDSAADYGVAGV